MKEIKLVGLAGDHAGYNLKETIKTYLEEQGIAYKDFGTTSPDSCDYPDCAHPLGRAVTAGEVDPAIAICGTGQGMAMTLNKYPAIRAALCWTPEVAQLARRHNDANVLVLPARLIDIRMARAILHEFFNNEFEGGRHLRRINKMPIHDE